MNCSTWASPASATAARKRLIVFDYDGTLADLKVDWVALRTDLSRRARDFGFMSTFEPLWPQMARLRDACGAEAVAALFAVLAEHERQGVLQQQPRAEIVEFARLMSRRSRREADDGRRTGRAPAFRLPCAFGSARATGHVPWLWQRGSRMPSTCVLAVFSANLHATVAAGLDALGLGSGISWIVGADDVTQWKPAPEGLRRAMQLAACTPADTLFVGDSAGDAAAAHAAGVDFWRV
jgi:phosphoglycolate phosphatase-like HAD superfamily hydrolase